MQSDQPTFLGSNKYQKGDFTNSTLAFYLKSIFNLLNLFTKDYVNRIILIGYIFLKLLRLKNLKTCLPFKSTIASVKKEESWKTFCSSEKVYQTYNIFWLPWTNSSFIFIAENFQIEWSNAVSDFKIDAFYFSEWLSTVSAPSSLFAGRTIFSPKFWKGWDQKTYECVGDLKGSYNRYLPEGA